MTGTTLVKIGDLGAQGTPASRTRHPDPRSLPLPAGIHRTRAYRRVLLINPPATLHKSDFPRCTYPLGIGYLAAMLTRHGYEVRLLDAFAKGYDRARTTEQAPDFRTYGISEEEIEEEVRSFAPHVVGVSSAKCTFCTTTNFWGGRVRRRSPENVCAELEELKRRYSIDEFHIQDARWWARSCSRSAEGGASSRQSWNGSACRTSKA